VIKGVGQVTDQRGTRPALILGLTRETVNELLAGELVRFECADMNLPPMSVSVLFGEDEKAVMTVIGPAARGARRMPGPDANGG